MAQAIVNDSNYNSFDFSKFYHLSTIRLCDVGAISVGTDALKDLSIGQISKHHEFIIGAELKDERGNKLTNISPSLEVLYHHSSSRNNLALSPSLHFSSSAPLSSPVNNYRDVKPAVKSADDILEECESEWCNGSTSDSCSERRGSNPCSGINNHGHQQPEDLSAREKIEDSCEVSAHDSSLFADDILRDCEVDNWDEEIAGINLNCVTIKDKVNSIARKRVEGVFA